MAQHQLPGSLLQRTADGLGRQFRLRGQRLGQRAGLHVARFSARYSAPLRRNLLLSALGVDVVLDVGANAGQYGTLLRRSGYTGRIVSFEPQRQPYSQLRQVAVADGNWVTRPCGLGSEAGEAEINVSQDSTASSLLPITERHLREAPEAAYVGRQNIELRRLDDEAEELTSPGERIAVKLDVQGFEGQVFAGGGRTLSRAVLVEAELLLATYYEGPTPASELIGILQGHGLEIAGTDPGHIDEVTGRFTWMDAVFIRPSALPDGDGAGRPG